MLRKTTTAAALLLAALAATGCEEESSAPEQIEAPAYQDGTIVLSDEGAFAVELWNEDGEATVGDNTFVLRVCMSDTDQGIPGAHLDFEAFMPDESVALESEPTISYLGDGQYQFANVVLTEAGTWQFDVDIASDGGVEESVHIAFQLAE
jgi:hypothetical protein